MRKPGVLVILLACLAVAACASPQGARQSTAMDKGGSGESSDSSGGGY